MMDFLIDSGANFVQSKGNEHYVASNWSLLTATYGERAGSGTLFSDPLLHNLANLAGGDVISIEAVTVARPEVAHQY